MRKAISGIVADDELRGKYFGDFFSEPSNLIHSRVYVKDGVVKIYWFLKEGNSISPSRGSILAGKWISEIFEYMATRTYDCSDVRLKRQAKDFGENDVIENY